MPASDSPSNPLVAALLGGGAPRSLRLSAARGVLPLSRLDLVRILVSLHADLDADIRREAASTFGSVPSDELAALLEDPSTPVEVLSHVAATPAASSVLKEAVLANPVTPAALVITMAPALSPGQVDLILANQTRLIMSPELLACLESLESLTPLQKNRCSEIRRHFLDKPARRPPEPERAGPAAPDAEAPTSRQAVPETAADSPAATTAGGVEEVASAEDALPDAAVSDNVLQKILRMHTAEKIQLAMKGTREERGILIRDASRVVQQAVLESPKLTENEVEGFAKMRTATEEVLRTIAGHRDWVKNYAVLHALTTNPKTPIGMAMNMLSRLTNRDIKLLIADRNVAEALRRHARRVSDARQQGTGKR